MGVRKPPKAILRLPGELLDDFWGVLGGWERGRALWLSGGLSALAVELFSYFYFQRHLGLKPCEYCVLIRFAVLGLALGGFLGAIVPAFFPAKLPGYLLSLSASLWGLHLSVKLDFINLAAMDPDFFSPCASGRVKFPFGLEPDKLFPAHFSALGTCGADSAWSFWDFTMPEILIIVFSLYILGLLLMLAASILARRRSLKGSGATPPAGT
ncbi:MAG: disulfide bond formation protein B [Deltaproteobacteria bacterium]|nr:disulfide bond formation protein B [Deltaproteobacteria bacterium]